MYDLALLTTIGHPGSGFSKIILTMTAHEKIGVELDTAFDLSVAPAQLNNLEELMMVVKYSF
jgi:UDP-galactopyranose mutase